MVIGDVISGFRGSGLRYLSVSTKRLLFEFNQKNIMSLSERPPALTLFFANQTSANDSVCRIHVVIPTLCFFRTEEVATREAMMSLTTSFLLRRCRLLLAHSRPTLRAGLISGFSGGKKNIKFFFRKTSRDEGLRHVTSRLCVVTDEDGTRLIWVLKQGQTDIVL
jgi:hypothetical protein